LKKNKTFRYEEGTCTGASTGIGKYEIIGDTIKFRFEDHIVKRGVHLIKNDADLEEGIIVDLTAVDSQSQKVLIGYNAALFSDGTLLRGEIADLMGKAELTATSGELPVKIELSYAGYFPLSVEIRAPGRYSVVASMVNGYTKPIKAQEWVYRLIKLNPDSMVIAGFDNKDSSIALRRYDKRKK
jgi:hypothetical protein